VLVLQTDVAVVAARYRQDMAVWRRSVRGVPMVDVALAVALAIGAAVTVLALPWSVRTGIDLVVSCSTAAVAGLRRRAPLVMAGAFTAGLLALAVVHQGGTTMWAFVALLVVAFSITAELPRPASTWATVLLFLAAVAYDAATDRNGIGSVLSPLVIVGAPASAGLLLRHSRAQAAHLSELARELAAQRDLVHEAAVLAERNRIARELHDVIAHTVGVMVVQAGAAEKRLQPGHPASDSIRAIRQTGKEAMQELRRVVGVLRTTEEDGGVPQPGLGALAGLVEVARSTCDVDTDIDDDLVLASGMALTVYRTVQEALTNAQRYAPGSRVHVGLRRSGQQIEVTVEDDGSQDEVVGHQPGFGLIGLAERASLYGGSLEAGPRPDQLGWRVRTTLPLEASQVIDAVRLP
jgi:signal transduction histidine kinase